MSKSGAAYAIVCHFCPYACSNDDYAYHHLTATISTSSGGVGYALTSSMGMYPKSGSMFYLTRKEAPRSDPACLTRRTRMRCQDLLRTVSQVMKRHPKRTPMMRKMIVNGLAQVAMKSARMAQTRILTRNPTSPVPTEWPDN